jgi:hypothetical protein
MEPCQGSDGPEPAQPVSRSEEHFFAADCGAERGPHTRGKNAQEKADIQARL